MALTAAQISAIHQGANQLDMHNETLRSAATQLGSLNFLPDYNTIAGGMLEEVKQTILAKMTKLSGMLDELAAAHRSTAGSFDATNSDMLTHLNATINPVLNAISM